MQQIPALEMKIVGTRAFMLNTEWPTQIRVSRGLVEALQQPVGIAIGRRGALLIEAANGTARYQRAGDIDNGWLYELKESTKIIPVAPDPPADPPNASAA